MIHTLFDKVYLINLNKRADRLASVDERCKRIGLEYSRFEALDGDLLPDPGIDFDSEMAKSIRWNINSYALLLTTIEIIKEAKRNNYKNILILEDDVDFHGMFNSHVKNGFESLPENWDMYFLGVTNIKDFTMFSRYVARITGALYCHSYAVNRRAYDKYINALEKKEKPIDMCTLEEIQPEGNCYAIVPSMANQISDYSDISKQIEDHNILRNS